MKRTCPRCGSSMVRQMESLNVGLTEHWGWVWQCIGCGRQIEVESERRHPEETRPHPAPPA